MLATIKFAKIRDTAKIPTKRIEDAAFDIYADFEEQFIGLLPHTTTMIPTGIASACDTDYCFILKERGSTGSKGLAQRCGVIDSGYRGEWFVPITNTNDYTIFIAKEGSHIATGEYYKIYPYDKAICQAMVVPVPETEVEEYTFEELTAIPSERGTGALGSSQK